ncbi:HAMP domain-containing sensor histidine kinase [Lactovum miscens]|uniref:Signal transduction histidine-protein kinase ArlS n=1 Tax=Lactovum miscens TaxID=190387 RepID=A0A841C6J1_9LACT|nr:ATP-binding protein [Lactovum miscens]MBB5887222.1 signal transduction histidine kinase [Lactovum miscens]
MINKAVKAIRTKKSRPKKSILRRWSIANAAFFFVAILIVAFASFRIVLSTIDKSNKQSMIQSMNNLVTPLQESDVPLSVKNLKSYLKIDSDLEINKNEYVIQTSPVLSNMIGQKNLSFYIYGNNKKLIFSTLDKSFPFHRDTGGKTVLINYKGSQGFLLSKAISSVKSNQIVGYALIFFNLDPFTSLAQEIFSYFVWIALVGFVTAAFFGYWMGRRFTHPISKITGSMEKVAAHPDEKFVPVEIEQEDEVGQIAKFYNSMMNRVNYYIEQQKGFVSDVSHELRTPLAVIDGHLKLLKRWGKDDPKVLEESLSISIDEISNVKLMLEEMLSISRLENLPYEYLMKKCTPLKETANALTNFKLLHKDFIVELDNKVIVSTEIQMDPSHYVQALNILLENAVKYSPDIPKSIKLTLRESGKYVEASVSDQGMGISKEDQNLIFERFYRADRARNREIGGTGLGLSILSKMIKQYQGEIKVESKLGEGSIFTFKIPKVKS